MTTADGQPAEARAGAGGRVADVGPRPWSSWSTRSTRTSCAASSPRSKTTSTSTTPDRRAAVGVRARERARHRARRATSPTAGTAPARSVTRWSAWSVITMFTAAVAELRQLLVGCARCSDSGRRSPNRRPRACSPTTTPPASAGRVFSNQQVMVFIGFGLGIALGGAIGSRVRLAGRVPRRRPAEPRRRRPRLHAAEPKPRPRRSPARRREAPRTTTAESSTSTLFEHGASASSFVDMMRGLRDDFRTIWQITDACVTRSSASARSMFTVAGIGVWLPAVPRALLGDDPEAGDQPPSAR